MQAHLARRLLRIQCAATTPAVELNARVKQGLHVPNNVWDRRTLASERTNKGVVNIYIHNTQLRRDQRFRRGAMLSQGRSWPGIYLLSDRIDANRVRIEFEFTELLLIVSDRPPRATGHIGARYVRIGGMFKLEMEAEPVHTFKGADAELWINFNDASAPAALVRVSD